MFRVTRAKNHTMFRIRILKSRSKEFGKFRKELEQLLKKHKVRRAR
jgi:hypothetical protein